MSAVVDSCPTCADLLRLSCGLPMWHGGIKQDHAVGDLNFRFWPPPSEFMSDLLYIWILLLATFVAKMYAFESRPPTSTVIPAALVVLTRTFRILRSTFLETVGRFLGVTAFPARRSPYLDAFPTLPKAFALSCLGLRLGAGARENPTVYRHAWGSPFLGPNDLDYNGLDVAPVRSHLPRLRALRLDDMYGRFLDRDGTRPCDIRKVRPLGDKARDAIRRPI